MRALRRVPAAYDGGRADLEQTPSGEEYCAKAASIDMSPKPMLCPKITAFWLRSSAVGRREAREKRPERRDSGLDAAARKGE